MMTNHGYVIGVDAGGTSSRACVMNAVGEAVARGTSGGANLNAFPTKEAATNLSEAIKKSLSTIEKDTVKACVIGIAGINRLLDPETSKVFYDTLNSLNLKCPMRIVSDPEVGFAAATPSASGTVLVAGTGSIAVEIRDRILFTTAGGFGVALGDEGSGFWIGREAVRKTLEIIAAQAPIIGLAQTILSHLVPDDDFAELPDSKRRIVARRKLLTAVYGQPPISLAALAPLVSSAHHHGDPVATDIIERAAQHLIELLVQARTSEDFDPVVFVGSVLSKGSPVRTLVEAKIPQWEIIENPDGALGAAWLAAVDAFGAKVPHPTQVF